MNAAAACASARFCTFPHAHHQHPACTCHRRLLTQDEETSKPKLCTWTHSPSLRQTPGRHWRALGPAPRPHARYVGHTHAATGGSAIQAIKVLVDHGVQLDRILFLNMIASPEGLKSIWEAFPQVRVISAWVDAKLSEQNYSTPTHSRSPAGSRRLRRPLLQWVVYISPNLFSMLSHAHRAWAAAAQGSPRPRTVSTGSIAQHTVTRQHAYAAPPVCARPYGGQD